MADLEKTVSIIFSGTDKLSGTLSEIDKGMNKFESKLLTVAQPLADLANGVLAADAAIASMAVGGMVASVTAAGKFQSGLAEIHTLVRDTPEAIALFDKSIEDYAINSTQSIDDIQKAIYQALSANINYKESVQFVSDAEKLAVAGKSTLTEAVDLLTDTLTAYGVSSDQAGKFSDVFFKTVEIGKVTVPQLAEALSMVTGIAGPAGISIEEVSAAIAALTAGGLKSGQSAEYLRQVISDLIKPSAGAKDEFERLGIAFGGNELAAKGLSGKLAEIWEKSDGNIDSLSKLFGNVTGLTAALILGSDKSGYFAKALDELSKSAGATQRAYDIMVGQFELINQRLVNSITATLVSVGKPLLDDWAKLAESLGLVFKGVKLGFDAGAFDDVYDAIEDFVNDLTDDMKEIAQNLPEALGQLDFTELLKSLGELGEEMADFFEGIDLTTPEGLANALQKVVDFLTGLVNVTKGMAEVMVPIFKTIADGITSVGTADKEEQNTMGNILGASKLLVDMGLKVVVALAAIQQSGTEVQNVYNVLAGTLKAIWNTLQIDFDAASLLIVDSLDAVLASIQTIMGPFAVAFDPLLKAMGGVSFGDMIKGIDSARKEMSSFREGIVTDLGNQLDDFGKGLNQVGDGFTGAGSKAGAAAGEVDKFGKAVKDIPTDASVNMTAKETDDYKAIISKVDDLTQKQHEIEMSVIAGTTPIDDLKSRIEALTDSAAQVKIDMDAEEAMYEIDDLTNGVEGYEVKITPKTDDAKVAAEKKKLDDLAKKEEKEIEIKLKGEIDKEIARINAAAKTVQTAMEWTAKVSIAQAESDAKRLEAAFSNVGSVVTGSGDVISKLFENIPDSNDPAWTLWRDALQQEMNIQKESWDKNKTLLEEQIKYMKIKNERLESGEPLIQIETSQLEPELEMVLWKIIEKCQIRASEEAADFLLGI